MKTQKNKAGLCHYKTNDRWKWMAGATAATAAGVTASQAGTITVTLSGNFISSSLGNHLSDAIPASAGGGTMDLKFSNAAAAVPTNQSAYASVIINGVLNHADRTFTALRNRNFARATFGTHGILGSDFA